MERKRRVRLAEDELAHDDSTIEWWYYNGFLQGKKKYAFMTCLFKVNKEKANISLLKFPGKTIYFSHSLLFDLDTGKVKKEILPFVLVDDESIKRKSLLIDYFYPLRKEFVEYETAELDKKFRVKTGFFDLFLKPKKKPILENKTGFIDLGEKTMYYYSYTNMDANGYVGEEKVKGKAWHDRQWSDFGFTRDFWIWFSIQLPDNTEIVCFDYQGKRFATASYPNGKQKEFTPKFKAIGKAWKSKRTGMKYNLEWEIQIGKWKIRTKPFINECEMNFGIINYWEGPVSCRVNGKKARGFMEYVAKPNGYGLKDMLMHKFDFLHLEKKLKGLHF
jgi:predicted secreted hydrolase